MFDSLNHRKRITILEESFEKLQRDFNALKREWADALEKITRMAGRVAKRSAIMQEKEDALMGKDVNGAASELLDTQIPLPGVLTPRMRTINAQIAARRQHLLQGGK